VLVSVVIPTLNEEHALPALLDALRRLPGKFEVIVADGGSSDATRAVAGAGADVVLDVRGGRARQLDAGAAASRGDPIVFVHADSRLPPDAYRSLTRACADPAIVGGNFALRFDGDDRFSRVLSAVYGVQRRLGLYYGDSSIWVRRLAFEALGGHRELAIMDDYDFARRLQRLGPTTCLPGPALTSARRWQQMGVARTLLSWIVIRWLFVAGVSPQRLARLYRRVR